MGALRSFVTAFFNLVPFSICPRRAFLLGTSFLEGGRAPLGGGGGGGPPAGGGGGGGPTISWTHQSQFRFFEVYQRKTTACARVWATRKSREAKLMRARRAARVRRRSHLFGDRFGGITTANTDWPSPGRDNLLGGCCVHREVNTADQRQMLVLHATQKWTLLFQSGREFTNYF